MVLDTILEAILNVNVVEKSVRIMSPFKDSI